MSGPFSWTFTTGTPTQCPCSIWQNGTPTGAVDAADTSAVNLGVQFQASSSGHITGVRFYKESDNTGTHIGSLWSCHRHAAGDRHVHQRDRVRLAGAGLLHSGAGHGRDDLRGLVPHQHRTLRDYVNGLPSAVTNGPLTALAGGGVYAYGTGNTFPSSTLQLGQLLGRRGVFDPMTAGQANGE